MRRPLTTTCVDVRAAICDPDQSVDLHVDLVRLDIGVLLHNHVGGLVPGLTGRFVPGHHAFESRAVLGVVHTLRIAIRPASTARSARPSGMDNASAQRTNLAIT